MRITIDTKDDSQEDIRKVIRMLSHLVGDDYKTNASSNIFDDDNNDDTTGNAFANLFGDDNASQQTPENNNYLDALKPEDEEEPEDKPQTITEY